MHLIFKQLKTNQWSTPWQEPIWLLWALCRAPGWLQAGAAGSTVVWAGGCHLCQPPWSWALPPSFLSRYAFTVGKSHCGMSLQIGASSLTEWQCSFCVSGCCQREQTANLLSPWQRKLKTSPLLKQGVCQQEMGPARRGTSERRNEDENWLPVKRRGKEAACIWGREGEGWAWETGNSLRSSEEKWNRIQTSNIRCNKSPNKRTQQELESIKWVLTRGRRRLKPWK